MPTFTLVVRPDGSAILATRERLSEGMQAALLEQVRAWQDGGGIAVIPDCEVVRILEDIEIDLGEPKVPA
jgi:malate synthase